MTRRTLFVTVFLCWAILLGSGCSTEPTPLAASTDRLSATNGLSQTPDRLPTHSTATVTTSPSLTPTDLPTNTPSPSPSPTSSPSPTATPQLTSSLVAFESERNGNSEIYLLDTASGELLNLTRHPEQDRQPVWHPDGSAIAFSSRRSGNWEIYVLTLSDGSLQRMTDNLAYDGAPAWSPDGTKLAFESYRDGNLEIYTASVTTGQIQQITTNPAGDYGPDWSPDGESIAFTSWRDGNKEIYVQPVTGGQAQNLTQDPADDQDPAWSPSGSEIAFASWRDTQAATGNRNAEIYTLSLGSRTLSKQTDSPWPDLDPAWNEQGHLLWASYHPGPAFETYDPYRPGDYHLSQRNSGGVELLTGDDWDDRNPDPAPRQAPGLETLSSILPPDPPEPTAVSGAIDGEQVQTVQVPSILASYSQQPVRVSELVAPSLVAWQQDVLNASGHDFLALTLGSWRSIDQLRKRDMYKYDYGFLSWHKTGRALDLALEFKVDGRNIMLLTREDLAENVYWRIFLRAAKQDGTQGQPLKDNPWLYWWQIVPEEDPAAYDAGGKRLPIPSGYYVDVTTIAKRHGWERIACYAIEGDYHWYSDSNGTEYWHYERTDGLVWWEAMQQLYSADTLEQYVGWQACLSKAQSEAMMLSKGVPTPAP